MGRKKALTQQQVLETIQTWIFNHGMPPTVSELKAKLGLGSNRTVLRYLTWLQEEGYITRWPGARGIRLLKAVQTGMRTISIPLVGEAPAGPLMTAEQNLEGWVRVPAEMLRPANATYFLLRIRGDSMNLARIDDECIEDGDLALVRRQVTADSGQVVIALIDGEVTVKRLVRAAGYFLLRPESKNTKHQPIIADSSFAIQGIVVRVLKRGSELLSVLEQE